MKAPRYLLREALVREVLAGCRGGRFVEVGYGKGEMLVTLAQHGLTGVGYDISEAALQEARRTLAAAGVEGVELRAELAPQERFEYVLFFEVIGYWADPLQELERWRAHLSGSGKMIFSFTNSAHIGAAEKLTGNMKGFTRREVEELLARAGLRAESIWNYGYPLTNALKPFLNAMHRLRTRFSEPADEQREVQVSGLSQRYLANRAISLLLNPLTIHPFVVAQKLFRDSDRGTGYVVVARALPGAAPNGA